MEIVRTETEIQPHDRSVEEFGVEIAMLAGGGDVAERSLGRAVREHREERDRGRSVRGPSGLVRTKEDTLDTRRIEDRWLPVLQESPENLRPPGHRHLPIRLGDTDTGVGSVAEKFPATCRRHLRTRRGADDLVGIEPGVRAVLLENGPPTLIGRVESVGNGDVGRPRDWVPIE